MKYTFPWVELPLTETKIGRSPGVKQAVDWLHWRYEIGEARQALGRKITYNIKALRIMDQQNACVTARRCAGGLGVRNGAAADRACTRCL